jgi:protein TonB
MATESQPQLLEQEAIMVSVIEAPVAEQAKGKPEPIEPVVALPPQPSAPEPDSSLPEPAVGPLPSPKPLLAPKPKPVSQLAPTSPPPTLPQPVTGVKAGAMRNQAPQVGLTPEKPVTLSSVQYHGQRPVPTYPRMSQRLREEGTTIILVEIDTTGNVTRAAVSKSSGFERLDQAALEAARRARFTPAKAGGVARSARANLPFNFVLRN